MQIGTLIGELFLAITSIVSWVFASFLHKTIGERSPNAVRIPLIIATILGNSKLGLLDFRGVLIQLLILTMSPAIAVYIAGIISHQQFTYWYRGVAIFLLAIIIIELVKNR